MLPTSQHFTYSFPDVARIFGELSTSKKLQTNYMCLNIGQREKLLSSIAPYLFAYDPESEFGKWLLAKGWGNSWGMFEVAIEFELENGKLISKKVLKQDFWNRLNGTISAATADTEIKTEQPTENKDKPGRKWNFLID